jgi:hypothetical protein
MESKSSFQNIYKINSKGHNKAKDSTDKKGNNLVVNWGSNSDAGVLIINIVISTGEKTAYFKKIVDFYAIIIL